MNATVPMSPEAQLAILAAELHTEFVAKCLAAAALALALYEYILTLSNEVALFWTAKASSASASALLFFSVRVILLAIAATNIAGNYVPDAVATLTGCKSYNIWDATLTMLGYGMIAVISAIRVFAVTSRNWPLSLVTLALGLAPVVINIYLLTTAYYLVEPVPTTTICAVLSTLSMNSANHAKKGILTGSLSWYLLRDGTLYFSVILVLNLIDILLWWFDRIQFFTTLIFPLSLILLSRLLMNLRQAAYTDVAIGSISSPTRSSGSDLPTQMSDVLFVPPTMPMLDTETDNSPTLETFEDDEELEIADVAIVDGDDNPVTVQRLEANVLK
ncbi:uncharacterized protein C8Q71DRAFT_862591 [Rhodofomes roseus]|uniref:DUF6533 domain-containing protein n=1 Tax=Rhodofomes roseus TaxID=34475 RepID=A0ABQ8K0Z7_9APHY|nr:uncharacterized protein C8Q71DRAFT_862591 [Rhodofomes roseus]KAH9830297.1 hypothetical protein C8Q71DRAFT_862591 [Rhodofomes roseus]